MRSYREAFVDEEGRRGLSQEQLLRRMAAVNREYAQRFSHATVSRWESGHTRPTLARLLVFGEALRLSGEDVAGLVLLAGLAQSYEDAAVLVGLSDEQSPRPVPVSDESHVGVNTPDSDGNLSWHLGIAFQFVTYRTLPLAALIVGLGFAMGLLDWHMSWLPAMYGSIVLGVVLLQGFQFPSRAAGHREFFWISVFVLLTTPIFQYALLGLDYYNFYRIGDFADTPLPWMLVLLVNLGLASTAGLMYHFLWRWQYARNLGSGSPVGRAAWTVLPPLALVYGVVMLFSNVSVVIQLAMLFPALAIAFLAFLALKDPGLSLVEADRRLLFPAAMGLGMLGISLGIAVVLVVYNSPNMPQALPDHNLLASWDINFDELGLSRAEALDRINAGYVWHAMLVIAYMGIVVCGRFLVEVYRIGGGTSAPTRAVAEVTPVRGPGRRTQTTRHLNEYSVLGALLFRPWRT